MKPWEKRSGGPAAKPWEKRVSLAANSGASDALTGGSYNYRDVEDRFPDFVSSADRLITKNFSSSDAATLGYLRKQYPNVDFEIYNDEIITREKDGKWYKLDPSFYSSPAEALRDVGDVGSDIVGGAIENAASVGGAIAGAGMLPGVGAIPGAMAANGAASAGVEAGKQAIGSMLGIEDNYSPKNIAVAGGTGVLAPFLFGAGKVPAAKLAQVLGREVSEKEADQISRGLMKRAYDKAKSGPLPAIAETISGAPSGAVKNYAKHMNIVDELAQDPTYAESFVRNSRQGMERFIDEKKRDIRREIIQSLQEAGQPVNVENVKKVYQDRIAQLKSAITPDGGHQTGSSQLAAALESDYKELFGVQYPNRAVPSSRKNVNPADGYIDPVTLKWTQPSSEIPNALDGTNAFELQGRIRNKANYDGAFKGDVQTRAKIANEELRKSMDTATGGASQKAKDDFSDLMAIEENLGNLTNDDQAYFNAMSNLESPGRLMKKSSLQRIKDLGHDVTADQEVLSAYRTFADPAKLPQGLKGTTSTSRSTLLGSLFAGALQPLGPTMAAFGAASGNLVGSPAQMKRIMKINRSVEDMAGNQLFGNAITPLGRRALELPSSYLGLKDEDFMQQD